MRTLAAVLCAAFVCAVAGDARADSKPRTHDGFHFQLQGGLGYYSSSSDEAGQDFSGVTLPGALLMGGTIGPVAVGGGLILDYAPSPTYKVNDTEMPDVVSSQFILGLGLYVDYYMDAQKNGLHFQGFAGWGGLETSFSGNVGGSDPTGLVTSFGVGYEVWIADQWSAGVMGRFIYAPISLNSSNFTTIEPAVVGTLTWH